METFIISLIDPVLVVPAFCIGFFARGPVRLWLAGIFFAAFALLALGYGVAPPAAPDLFPRAVAAGLVLFLGVLLSRRRGRSQQAG